MVKLYPKDNGPTVGATIPIGGIAIEKPDLVRVIKKIPFLDLFGTIGAFFSVENWSFYRQIQKNIPAGSNLNGSKGAAVSNLSYQRTLSNATVMEALDSVVKIPGANAGRIISIWKDFINEAQSPETPRDSNQLKEYLKNSLLQDLPKVGEKILIPFVIKSGIRDHIIAMSVERTADNAYTIEYFDSKGLTILDREGFNRATVMGTTLSPKEFIETLTESIEEKRRPKKIAWDIKENTKKHQNDCHNCGVHVVDFFIRRLFPDERWGMNFTNVCSNRLATSRANEGYRESLMVLVASKETFTSDELKLLIAPTSEEKSNDTSMEGYEKRRKDLIERKEKSLDTVATQDLENAADLVEEMDEDEGNEEHDGSLRPPPDDAFGTVPSRPEDLIGTVSPQLRSRRLDILEPDPDVALANHLRAEALAIDLTGKPGGEDLAQELRDYADKLDAREKDKQKTDVGEVLKLTQKAEAFRKITSLDDLLKHKYPDTLIRNMPIPELIGLLKGKGSQILELINDETKNLSPNAKVRLLLWGQVKAELNDSDLKKVMEEYVNGLSKTEIPLLKQLAQDRVLPVWVVQRTFEVWSYDQRQAYLEKT